MSPISNITESSKLPWSDWNKGYGNDSFFLAPLQLIVSCTENLIPQYVMRYVIKDISSNLKNVMLLFEPFFHSFSKAKSVLKGNNRRKRDLLILSMLHNPILLYSMAKFLGSGSNKGDNPDFTDTAKGLLDYFSSLLISGAKKNESLPYPFKLISMGHWCPMPISDIPKEKVNSNYILKNDATDAKIAEVALRVYMPKYPLPSNLYHLRHRQGVSVP